MTATVATIGIGRIDQAHPEVSSVRRRGFIAGFIARNVTLYGRRWRSILRNVTPALT
jgi:hypothetical protein